MCLPVNSAYRPGRLPQQATVRTSDLRKVLFIKSISLLSLNDSFFLSASLPHRFSRDVHNSLFYRDRNHLQVQVITQRYEITMRFFFFLFVLVDPSAWLPVLLKCATTRLARSNALRLNCSRVLAQI